MCMLIIIRKKDTNISYSQSYPHYPQEKQNKKYVNLNGIHSYIKLCKCNVFVINKKCFCNKQNSYSSKNY